MDGFDIFHPFDARAVAAAEPGLAVLAAATRGILVGNTRALWPRFIAAVAADPTLAADPDPLDRYAERALARFPRVYFAHRAYDGAYLPFQRLAAAAGLGTLSATHLVIHPIYGPWFALRAVILDDEAPPPLVAAPRACTCGEPCTAAFARAAAAPADWCAWLAVRDACPIGRAWRYDDTQLAYHYTKDRRLLCPPNCTTS